jgi:hypothetical protein
VLALLLVVFTPTSQSFHPQALVSVRTPRCRRPLYEDGAATAFRMAEKNNNNDDDNGANDIVDSTMIQGRRSFIFSTGIIVALAGVVVTPSASFAGIDVSGLSSGGGSDSTQNTIANQLTAYDGSAAARVRQVKDRTTTTISTSINSPKISRTSSAEKDNQEASSTSAKFALRYGDAYTKLTKKGFGELYRYDEMLVGPKDSRVSVSFEFPSDWLQLDRATGGIQYVDQRNGDKLYVLRAALPTNQTLISVPKKFFGNVIFDQAGSIAKTGTTVEDYRVSKSTVISDGSLSTPHRRLTVKYTTVTGNGLLVERRALVDAYEIDGSDIYMIMTSSNAVKFEANGMERDTVEAIADSFLVG